MGAILSCSAIVAIYSFMLSLRSHYALLFCVFVLTTVIATAALPITKGVPNGQSINIGVALLAPC